MDNNKNALYFVLLLFDLLNTPISTRGGSQVALVVKNPVQETKEMRVPSLGQEDPLEEGLSTPYSILAQRIPWTKELAGCTPQGWKELDRTEVTAQHSTLQQEDNGIRVKKPETSKVSVSSSITKIGIIFIFLIYWSGQTMQRLC